MQVQNSHCKKRLAGFALGGMHFSVLLLNTIADYRPGGSKIRFCNQCNDESQCMPPPRIVVFHRKPLQAAKTMIGIFS